ncbi:MULTISPECIES: copper transporter [Corynebacterium]|uniref:copper transporter n=1 Tax=Corynebacterium TaxID=1716 RepID=UPI0019080D02|nr:copper transporter [Corynebacterium kefirresidentii]MCT2187525.1 copper transporter [Corynebacterium kefirresidentii]QQN46917.1 copper transporter [Corynebacterium kefirresidentii]
MAKTELVAGLGFGAAVGVALGALVIAPNLTTGMADDDPIREEHRKVVQDNKILQTQNEASDKIVADSGAELVNGALSQRPVLIVTTDDANGGDVDAIRELLETSGATEAGEIKLTKDFLRPETKDKLLPILKDTAPKKADTKDLDSAGALSGEVLGTALSMDPESTKPMASVQERADVLHKLRDEGFIDYEDGTIVPAQAIIVVSGNGLRGYPSDALAEFVTGLDDVNGSVVFSGRTKQTQDDKALAQVRDQDAKLSTVDGTERAVERIAVILATEEQLDGGQGDYGATETADSALPGKE